MRSNALNEKELRINKQLTAEARHDCGCLAKQEQKGLTEHALKAVKWLKV